jgi:hypothetical protein
MSLINVLEDITPESFPYIIERAIAVSLWNFQQDEMMEDHQAILVLRIPGTKDVSVPMSFLKTTHRCRAAIGVAEIPIERPCDVVFEVKLNGEHAASHKVRIHCPEVRSVAAGGKQMPDTR